MESAFESILTSELDKDLSDDEVIDSSDNETDSEIDLDSVDTEGLQESQNPKDLDTEETSGSYFYGRNHFKWSKSPVPSSEAEEQNTGSIKPKPTELIGPAKQNPPQSEIAAWSLIFDDKILDEIVNHTNAEITEISCKYKAPELFAYHTSRSEIKALIGLLYLSGIFQSNDEDAECLFATDGTGRDVFRATMPLKRFLFLLIALTFDDKNIRNDRIAKGDKLAPISFIFNRFIHNCQSCFLPGECCTVDKMLIGFRGSCAFKVYMKSKSSRYGIKLFCLCDVKTHYLVNAFVYTGKDCIPTVEDLSTPTQAVLSLVKPIAGTNRNITGNNCFSSIELVDELKKQSLTYVGTLDKNKREIPKTFLPQKSRHGKSSLYGYTNDATIVSYVPKKNKAIIALSSAHHVPAIDEESELPEIIAYYNKTKISVDLLEQKCALYGVNRRSRRWPFALLYAILNFSGVNGHVLHSNANAEKGISRYKFLINLGRALTEEHMKERLTKERIPRELRTLIPKLLGLKSERQVTVPSAASKRKRCYQCPSTNDTKHKTLCSTCGRTVCKVHSETKITCFRCLDSD